MIGNRHEQAVLVVMAYVVGFVTAYIAFGVTQVDEAQILYVKGTQTAQTAQAEQTIDFPTDNNIANINMATVVSSYYSNGMLSVNNHDVEFVLSVDSEAMPELVNDPQFSRQGLHKSPPVFVATSDDEFVYFCEEYIVPENCRSFVYSKLDNMIFPLTFAGERIEIPITDAATATWNGYQLQIANYTLTNTNGTWNMSVN